MSKKNVEWKNYEELVYNIYKELEPFADVRYNDSILGAESKALRQIDISLRSEIAGHEILIIIQAKNLKRKADVNVVGEFDAVIRDVRASKGILICSSGFTNKAKEYAKRIKIDLVTAHDASKKEWQTEIQVPVIKKSIKVSAKVQHHYVPIGPTSIDSIKFYLPEKAVNEFLQRWSNNELTKEPGIHRVELSPDDVSIHQDLIPLKTAIEYKVEHRSHFKFFTPLAYRGIKDYLTEKFTPSFMEFNEDIPFLNDGSWKYVHDEKEISLNTSHIQIEIVKVDLLDKQLIRAEWIKERNQNT